MTAPGCRGRGSNEVFGIKLRAGLLGLLAMLVLGTFSATPAFAEGGPFCHHSQNGVTDNGQIKAQMPEQVEGLGGEQRLEGKLVSPFKLVASGAQIKGIIYNNEDQCQAKLEIQYQPLKFEPEIAHCKASLPNNNIVKIFAHAAWKWLGTEAEQRENPIHQGRDWILLPIELQQSAKELPKTEIPFAVINVEKDGTGECLVASKQNRVAGSIFAGAKPAGLGEFRTTEELTALANGTKQQFWNGQYPLIGAESGLTFFGAVGKYTGEVKIKAIGRQQQSPQFIGFFEK
jgi:hypothetical protein